MTVAQAAEAFLTGARDGSIPTGKGTRYKPSAFVPTTRRCACTCYRRLGGSASRT